MTTPPRSPAGHELGEHELPAMPRHWLRTCNGVGETLISDYITADWCARQPGVTGTLATGLRWTAGSTQDPRLPSREFELRPLSEAEAREWFETTTLTR